MRTLALPAGAARFVGGGGRDVQTAKLATASELAAGEHVKLVDERDDELGLAVFDPDNALLRVVATPRDGLPAIDGTLIAMRVERALAWRTGLGLVGEDRAYRLIHHAGDGLPGLACDVLGRVAVIYAYGAALLPVARLLADAAIGFARLDGAVIKLRARREADDAPGAIDRSGPAGPRSAAEGRRGGLIDLDVVGKVPPRATVREHDVSYEVHPLGALNTGLFTDMREHRRGMARFARGRVLNLFSYTASLSLVCARGGAEAVSSVDTSEGVHAWARSNFERAGLAASERWQFHTGDAVRFLARAIKDRERYELVIIDPPTFSKARGQPWTLSRDYPALIAQAASVLADDGVLWLAANSHELAAAALAKLAIEGVRAAGREATIVEQGGLPPEYPTVAAQPHDRYLQICVLRVR